MVGLLAGMGCTQSSDSGSCFQDVEKTFVMLAPSDPPLVLRIESCRLDVDACPDLCQLVMERAGLAQPLNAGGVGISDGKGLGAPSNQSQFDAAHCSATFEGEKVSVKVIYQQATNNSSCAVTFGAAGSGSAP